MKKSKQPTKLNKKTPLSKYLIIFLGFFVFLLLTGLLFNKPLDRLIYNSPITKFFTRKNIQNVALRPSGIPSDWVEEHQCQGLHLFHPEDMYFFSTPAYDCAIGTVNGGINLHSSNQPWKLNKDQKISQVENVEIGRSTGRRILISNLQNHPVSLVYEFNQWQQYYFFQADLTKIDYSLKGNLDFYKNNPEWKTTAGVKEASPTASIDEFVQLIDSIAQTITFPSPPPTPDPKAPLLK